MMNRLGFKLCALFAAGAAILLVGCQSGIGGRTTPVPILHHSQADDAGFQHATVELINSWDELNAMGSTALNDIQVDFDSQSLVVLALGEQTTGGWFAQITGVQERGSELYVQGFAYPPSGDAVTTQAMSYPIAATIIPKSKATMIHPEIESADEFEAQ